MTEFNLSEKRSIIFDGDEFETEDYQYHEEDVKEFIRLLKETHENIDDLLIKELGEGSLLRQTIGRILFDRLDKLAGEKLNGN